MNSAWIRMDSVWISIVFMNYVWISMFLFLEYCMESFGVCQQVYGFAAVFIRVLSGFLWLLWILCGFPLVSRGSVWISIDSLRFL